MRTQSKLTANLLLSLLITLLGVFYSAFYAVSDRFALAFGQTANMAGFYISAFAAGSCLSALVSGALSDHLGKRRVICVSLGLLIAGVLTVALSNLQAPLLLGLFVAGVGFGPCEAMGSAYLTDLNPDCASRWMNISQIGFGLGAIGAPVAVIWYLTQKGGAHRSVFALCAALFLLMLAALLFTGRGQNASARSEKAEWNLFSVLKNPKMVLYALMVFFYMGYEPIGSGYFKQFFMARGETEAFSALMVSLFWASMILCRFIGAFMSGKELIGIKVFTSMMVTGALLLLLAPGAPWKVAGVFLYGFGCGPVWPMLFVLASRAFPKRSGAACGVMMLFSTAGNFLFPTLIGVWPGNLFVTLSLCALLGLALLTCAFLSERVSYANTPVQSTTM